MSDERRCVKCGINLQGAAAGAQHCPKCAGIADEPLLLLVSEQGFTVEFAEAAAGLKYDHVVGGPHEVPGAVCSGPGCNRPFIRLLTLDLRDPKLSFLRSPKRQGAGGVGGHQIALFYCWVCGGEPQYRVESDGSVSVLDAGSTGPEKDFPYPNYPASFPVRRAVLSPIPADVQQLIRSANDGTLDSDLHFDEKNEEHLQPRHQVGGTPYFVQGDFECRDCPGCGNLMRVLASAASDSGSEQPFADDPLIQIVFEYCARCQIVSASQQSD